MRLFKIDPRDAMDIGKAYHCEECEYDLTGLPEVGRCPECGRRYNTRSGFGVQIGDTAPVNANWFALHQRTLMLVAAALLLSCCAGRFSGRISSGGTAISISGALAILLLLGAVVSYLFENLRR